MKQHLRAVTQTTTQHHYCNRCYDVTTTFQTDTHYIGKECEVCEYATPDLAVALCPNCGRHLKDADHLVEATTILLKPPLCAGTDTDHRFCESAGNYRPLKTASAAFIQRMVNEFYRLQELLDEAPCVASLALPRNDPLAKAFLSSDLKTKGKDGKYTALLNQYYHDTPAGYEAVWAIIERKLGHPQNLRQSAFLRDQQPPNTNIFDQ